MALTKYRRMQLLRECELPTITEVRQQMGSPLAEIFFPSTGDETKTMLGLIPLLQGVESNQLWLSPSDILIGKVMMTPPMPTRRVVRALTHEGITEIGEGCLYKIENEHRIDKEQSLLRLQAYLESVAKEERERAVALAREEEREIHDRHIEELLAECREEIETAIDDTEVRLNRYMSVRIQEEREQIHELMTDKMTTALQEERDMLMHHFTLRMMETIRDLNHHYAHYIGGIIAHFHWRLRLVIHQNKQDVMQLRYRLEAQNQVDVAYAVCRERQRCQADKDRIREEFEIQIEELTKFIDMKILELEEANVYYEEQVYKNAQWKQRVRDIVKEFQKFINFALKSVPGQAQFLLSLERLLILEMLKPVEVAPPVEAIEEEEKEVEESLIELRDESTTMTANESISGMVIDVPLVLFDSEEELDDEGEEIGNYMLDEMKTSAENTAGLMLDEMIKAATPPTPEDIVVPLLHRMINKTVHLTEQDLIVVPIVESIVNHALEREQEEIAISIVDSIFNHATMPTESEVIAVSIVESIVEHALPPPMFDADTQIPSLEEIEPELHDPYYDEIIVHSIVRNSLSLETISNVNVAPTGSRGKMHLLSQMEIAALKKSVQLEPSRQECAWCEIKDKRKVSVCFKDQVEPKPSEELQQKISAQVSSELIPPTTAQESSTIRKDSKTGRITSQPLVSTKLPPEERTFQEHGYVGEGGIEHEQDRDEFVHDRLQSLLSIFKDHPSLSKAFIR